MKLSTVSLVIAFVLAMEGSALAYVPPPPPPSIHSHTAGSVYKNTVTGGGSLQTIIQGQGAGTSTQISIGNTGSSQTSLQIQP